MIVVIEIPYVQNDYRRCCKNGDSVNAECLYVRWVLCNLKFCNVSNHYKLNEPLNRNGSTCVDLVDDSKNNFYTLFISQESKVNTKKTESLLVIFKLRSSQTISIK